MISGIFSFLVSLIASICKDAISDWRRDKEIKKAGAIEASLKTLKDIQELSDAQHENDMRPRGNASDVAGRLRERLQSSG